MQTSFNWPYTLDGGSPGHEILVEWGSKEPINPHPGLWEMPAYPVVVPPDSAAAEYGIPVGLRAKLQSVQSWFDTDSGKITGFDYNLWVSFNMTKEEVVATLKYTLDQRLEGNRAPLLVRDALGLLLRQVHRADGFDRGRTTRGHRGVLGLRADQARGSHQVGSDEVLDWIQSPAPL